MIVYEWSQFTPIKQIKKEYGVRLRLILTVIDCFKRKFKDLKNIEIGGPGTTVEIDETVLSKRKYNTGRHFEQIWCIGGICEETKEVFYKLSTRRTAAVLHAVINNRVRPSTRIITDEWRGYRNLDQNKYTHKTICHKNNFVSPDDPSIHTQNIEVYWRYLKKYLKSGSPNNKKRLEKMVSGYIFIKSTKGDFMKILHGLTHFKYFQ